MLDDYWRLASGIELHADLRGNHDADDADRLGMVRARRHATGWFFSAHHEPGMSPDELSHLAEFAKVRAYLLLSQGPTPSTWVPGPAPDEWLAWSLAERRDLALVPDAVPANWGRAGA